MTSSPQSPKPATESQVRSPAHLRLQATRMAGQRDVMQKQRKRLELQSAQLESYLGISDKVTGALQQLSEQLFERVLGTLQTELTRALSDVLEQPIQFRATADFKRNSAVVEFSIERDGHQEDMQRGQGGSVHNVLSVGLRMFALATLDDSQHRRFLVLDEQDCWLRPELVPRLVGIVHQAARELGFQVLMISHHDLALFDHYADRIYQLEPAGSTVKVTEIKNRPVEPDQ